MRDRMKIGPRQDSKALSRGSAKERDWFARIALILALGVPPIAAWCFTSAHAASTNAVMPSARQLASSSRTPAPRPSPLLAGFT